MLNMIVGSGGGGKSYEAVAFHLLPALIAGRKVITNLPVYKEIICHIEPEALTLLKVIKPSKSKPRPFSTLADYGDPWRHKDTGVGPLYIIDEAHKALPRGGYGRRTADQDVLEMFGEIRHEIADALLFDTVNQKVHPDITENIHLQYKVRKNLAFGSQDTYTRKVIDGDKGAVMNTSIRTYKPVYFKRYKSHTKSDSAGQEAMAADLVPIWRHWSVIGATACLLFGIYAGFSGMLNPFPDTTKKVAPVVVKPKVIKEKIVTVEKVENKKLHSDPEQEKKAELTPEQIAKLEQIAEYERDKKKHPLSKLSLHISGSIKRMSTGEIIHGIDVAQNGQKVFSITPKELIEMGYELDPKSACLLGVKYGQYEQWITCDSPRQSLRMAGLSRQGGPAVRGEPAAPNPARAKYGSQFEYQGKKYTYLPGITQGKLGLNNH